MTELTLCVVDTAGIQDYVFNSNNLKQNVGASYLVDCATREWAIAAIPGKHNVINLEDPENAFTNQQVNLGQVEAEIVYAGGGNIVILFAREEMAREFTRNLSRKVLLEAPGLRIVIVWQTFTWELEPLGGGTGVMQQVMERLAEKKACPPVSLPIPGLSVTAECVYTGKPAVTVCKDKRLISAEANAKINAEEMAFSRLVKLFDWHEYNNPPREFSDLGISKGEKSYLAIVHTDGNGMGKRIEAIKDHKAHALPGDGSRAYIKAMRELSTSVQEAAYHALQKTIDYLKDNVDKNSSTIGGQVPIVNKHLPFRPIVYGGDDVTFVCDGRLGLSLARYYLSQYASQQLSDGKQAYGRAGVAIVHYHFPFSQAYVLAEELCASAKKFILDQKCDLSAMDWHIASSGLLYGLEETRLREYCVPAGNLCMRPVSIETESKTWRSWDTFEGITTAFTRKKEDWVDKHNKMKALREALRGGETETKKFMQLFSISQLPELKYWPEEPNKPAGGKTAWFGGRCIYFDAVEAADLHIPLKSGD